MAWLLTCAFKVRLLLGIPVPMWSMLLGCLGWKAGWWLLKEPDLQSDSRYLLHKPGQRGISALEPGSPGFKCPLHRGLGPLRDHLASLSLSFPSCKIGPGTPTSAARRLRGMYITCPARAWPPGSSWPRTALTQVSCLPEAGKNFPPAVSWTVRS